MRALVWHGKEDIRCETVPDPKIEQPRDAILKVTSCAICGSDLHLYDHFMIGMQKGDVMGHESMGEVVQVGLGVNGRIKVGERVVVPFTIICGECEQCRPNECFHIVPRISGNHCSIPPSHRPYFVGCTKSFRAIGWLSVPSACSTNQADQGYAALNDIRELSALRIAVSVVCLCSAISIAAFNSGTV